MTDNNQRVQVFTDYSIEFSTKIPKINEKFARLIIQFLYKDDNIMIENQNNDDYIMLLDNNNLEIPNIDKDTETNVYTYGLLINSFVDNGKYIIAGLIVVNDDNNINKNIPYLFICSGDNLQFWKTDINNYDGNFILNKNEFLIENKLGIKTFIEDSQNNSKLFIPFKSSFLIGPKINIIKDQQSYIYQSNGLPVLFIFKKKSLMNKNKVSDKKVPLPNSFNRRKTVPIRRKK